MLTSKSSSSYVARSTSHGERDSSVVRCSSTSAARTRVSGPCERGQRVQVDAPLDGAQGVEVDLVEGVGDRRRPGRADPAHVSDRGAVLGDDRDERGAGGQWSADPLVGLLEGGRCGAEQRRGVPEVDRSPAARHPARRRRRRQQERGGDFATSYPKAADAAPDEHDGEADPCPGKTSHPLRTTPDAGDEDEHGDDPADDRRGAEELAELGPGEDVERHADRQRRGHRAGRGAWHRPTRRRRARRERAPSAPDRGRSPAPRRRRGRRSTMGRARRRA